MRLLEKTGLSAVFLMIAASAAARADQADLNTYVDSSCRGPDLLECFSSTFSDVQADTVPLSLDSGIWYPQLGGIYSTRLRRQRAGEGTEVAIATLPEGELRDLLSTDPKTAYRLLSADPTAENLFLSLHILAQSTLHVSPADAPDAYLMMSKVIQSTLYAAAEETNAAVYKAAQDFDQCVEYYLIEGNAARLQDLCLAIADNEAERLLDNWPGANESGD
ncbi:MAG: hypothetical protein Tsb0019_04750 [Roseibium sp.]